MHFILYSCCMPVKGYKRSVIYDLQRNLFRFIPNSLYDIIQNFRTKTVKEIVENIDNENDIAIQKQYIEYLIENEFGFYTEFPERFPEISQDYLIPLVITTSILDIDSTTTYEIKPIIYQLEELGCRAVQIRFYDKVELSKIQTIITYFENIRITSIELFVKYNDSIDIIEWIELSKKYNRVSSIVIHSSNDDSVLYSGVNHSGRVMQTKQKINSSSHCGIINPLNFTVNLPFYLESINFNSCLNKKISIDIDGEIKNCPTMSKSYGNIDKISLLDALEISEFKTLWNVNKNEIEVCKDCEFRYMCTDCRAFGETNTNNKFKPKKCTYDPYTNIWE